MLFEIKIIRIYFILKIIETSSALISPIKSLYSEIIIYIADSTHRNCVIHLIEIHRVENITETDDPILRITLEWSLLIKAGGTSVHAVWNTPSISASLLIVWANLVSKRRTANPSDTRCNPRRPITRTGLILSRLYRRHLQTGSLFMLGVTKLITYFILLLFCYWSNCREHYYSNDS